MTSQKNLKQEYEHMKVETLFDKMKKSIDIQMEPEEEDVDNKNAYFTQM